MKILMVTRRFPPDCISGTETVFRSLYHRAREHHEVRLITGWTRARSLVPPEAIAVDISKGSAIRRWARMARTLRKELGSWKPDVLLTNAIELPGAAVPTVGLIHDMAWSSSKGVQDIAQRKLFTARARQLDLVITSNSIAARILAEQGVSEKKLRVVPNGVDLEKYSPCDSGSKRVHFICPSRIFMEKGQHLAIEAFARLKRKHKAKAKLSIVGAVQDRLYLDRLLVQAHGQPVQFSLDVPEMRPYYRESDVVVLPSLNQEGFAFAAVEAMASGKPLIWFDQPVVREATGGQGIAVPMTDVQAMTQAMTRLIEDPDERTAHGEAGRRYAEGNHNWSRVWQQYEAAIRSIAVAPRWN